MSIELQNWFVYGIVAIVVYLLMGATIVSLVKKLFGKKGINPQESQYLKIYSNSCKSCDLAEEHNK
ncbi:MAG: hypothetical protein JJT78_00470 [Leptospira sp.]|nr:hypothetical protein [Leptospira sp.]